MNLNDVLNFWFKELTPSDWFATDPKLDEKIKKHFFETLHRASQGELYGWRTSSQGRLAEIIVLDQFSRNIHRGTAQAFATDGVALVLAQEIVALKLDQELPLEERVFAYMPFMHSESRLIHETALKLFDVPGIENNYKFEVAHKEIIDRFGRYPHRNKILNRESTPEEIEFLKTHSGF